MRSKRLMIAMLLVITVLMGCQFFPTGVTPSATPINVGTPYPSLDTGAYPPVEIPPTPDPYLQPEQQAAPPEVGLLYPDLKDGDSLQWYQAVGVIYLGQVTKVLQDHSLNVYITLKDGRTLVTVEPQIDDILKVIEQCGEICKDIRVATE